MGKREEGFTLIELIVVLLILGILAIIILPGFSNKHHDPEPTPFVQPAKQEYCAHRAHQRFCKETTFGPRKHALYCSETVLMPDPEVACIRVGKVWAFAFARLGRIEWDFADSCFAPPKHRSQPADFEADVRAYRTAVEKRVAAGFEKPNILPMDEMKSICDLSRNGGTTAGVALSP